MGKARRLEQGHHQEEQRQEQVDRLFFHNEFDLLFGDMKVEDVTPGRLLLYATATTEIRSIPHAEAHQAGDYGILQIACF